MRAISRIIQRETKNAAPHDCCRETRRAFRETVSYSVVSVRVTLCADLSRLVVG